MSTCHWCHVMAHESFENEEVAEHMNDVFVCIKVDREERPDIDNIYMSVCQMMTGSGGWPLTIVMTPDRKPFFAATYLPKQSRYGRMGMLDLTSKINELWKNEYEDILDSADKITKALQEEEVDSRGETLGKDVLNAAYMQFNKIFDDKYGGFRNAPKFPTPHNLMFLLRYWKRSHEDRALNMVLKTLDSMVLGGIFDQVGYGFHRYSTDSRWFLPHFEKMLYDQALLAMAYTEAYQATGNIKYKETTEKIFEYVNRDLISEEGVFYSAEDADSEGEEGKFYVWSVKELYKILDEDDAKLVIDMFNLSEEGNFREEATGDITGNNILHLTKPATELQNDLKVNGLETRWEGIRGKLFAEREKRVRPHRDDKVLTDWNGLMIAALSKAGAAFNNDKLIASAIKAADFILNSIGEDKRLLHRYRNGEWNVTGNVDDYTFLIWGLIELYEVSFDIKYLKAAIKLNTELLENFWDNEKGGLFFTSSDAEKLLIRNKEIYDGAVPSGNSVELLNLLRLARITGDSELENKAEALNRAFSQTINNIPYAYSQFLAGIDFQVGLSYEVAIAGDANAEDTKEMLKELRKRFIPNKVVVLNPANEKSPEIYKIAEYLSGQEMKDNKATAYVCMNFACNKPTNDVEEMLNSFEA